MRKTSLRAETISDTHELVSFDVKSLFPSISMQLAIESMNKEALMEEATCDDELPVSRKEILDLLMLCLESTFSQYNGRFYQQTHDTAMQISSFRSRSRDCNATIGRMSTIYLPKPTLFLVSLRRRYLDEYQQTQEEGIS